MADDSESYQTFLEDNHWVMVKSVDPEVFLDYMRQHRVLTEDDCQVVQNYFINQTRRARMRCFLDIIRTKGPENIQLFFQQLGWEYPHVYCEIFRQDPSVPPQSYRQDTKSRLSCDLNQLLTVGLDRKRLLNQKQDMAEQIKDMEAMLKHQKNEIEDLDRENQRLRQYERENQQNKEKLRTLTTKNEEIKEENRQFLHEIRTLTLELQKRRDQETSLQAKLDEMTQQIQEKSFELNRKNIEESDLRAKYEHVRKESLKFQSMSQARSRRQDMVVQVTQAQHAARQNDLQQQLEILTDDMKNLEETNRDLCDQLQYMQDLLDREKDERDQMHRRVCALELDKNTLETRQITSVQKIERYYNKIKELEEEKRKLEEERMHIQTKIWEMSQVSEKQFEQQHKLENRYDQLQQSYEQFRQDHRYCVPGEPLDKSPRQRLPGLKDRPGLPSRPGRLPSASPSMEDENSLAEVADGDAQPVCVINPVCASRCIERSGSLTVNIPGSMKKKNKQEQEDSAESENAVNKSPATSAGPQQSSRDGTTVTRNFFIRSNIKEEAEGESLAVGEGDILYVLHTGKDQWKVMGVDKMTATLCPHHQGFIPNPDNTSGKPVRRNPSDLTGKPLTLERKYAIRREGLRHQHSFVNAFTNVNPMKATRLLPVLLLCPTSAMKSMLRCMESTAQDWASIIHDGHIESSAQLFAESSKHNVLAWEVRPKDPQRYNNNLHKFIIITITLQSQDAVDTLRQLLQEPDLTLNFDQETKYLKERQDLVARAGLHSETVTVVAGQDDREAFWKEVKDKVTLVQQRVFWLETVPTSR